MQKLLLKPPSSLLATFWEDETADYNEPDRTTTTTAMITAFR
jgi:hypothetical protein